MRVNKLYAKIIALTLFILGSLTGFSQTYEVEDVNYQFNVHPLNNLNSKYNDFSPIVQGKNIIFTSGREANVVLQGENNWKNTGFVNIFTAKIKGEFDENSSFETPKLFDKALSNNNHSGPICFTSTFDTVFFTQLSPRVKKKKELRKPQLYMAIKTEGEWEEMQLLPFCNPENSFGHPSWNSLTNELYFSSTMEGGKGGKDIYKVKLENSKWSQPLNLSEFNTEFDEVFPFIIQNDLFFSSNRPNGQGGLDIYWKTLNHEQKLRAANELNTSEDDHGIFILPGLKKGLYSKQISGIDMIYYLEVTRSVTVTNELSGQFSYRNLNGESPANLKVQLIHEGDINLEMETDEDGKFNFRNLPYENYTIKILDSKDVELVLFDKDGNQMTSLIQDGEGNFQYKKIDYETAGTLSLIEEMNDGISMNYRDISGQFVYEKLNGEYSDSLKVMLVDEDGNIIFTEYTDERGNFTFKNIPLEQNYLIKTEELEEDMFLFVFNEKGEVITQLKQNETGEYVYKKIRPDLASNLQYLVENQDVFELHSQTITGNFNYKKLEGEFGEGLTVYIFSEEGLLLDSSVTNKRGQFRFNNLEPDESFVFKLKESGLGFDIEEFNLFVEDRFGNVLADLYRDSDGFFRFKKIDVVTNNLEIKKTNESENFSLSGTELNIYFDLNSSYTSFSSNEELNKLIKKLKTDLQLEIQISAFADCRSSDEYNMWLSERRGEHVRDYLINKGVGSSRINVKAFGESKLINNCGDNTDCPDEEHAKNRRVQLRLVN